MTTPAITIKRLWLLPWLLVIGIPGGMIIALASGAQIFRWEEYVWLAIMMVWPVIALTFKRIADRWQQLARQALTDLYLIRHNYFPGEAPPRVGCDMADIEERAEKAANEIADAYKDRPFPSGATTVLLTSSELIEALAKAYLAGAAQAQSDYIAHFGRDPG